MQHSDPPGFFDLEKPEPMCIDPAHNIPMGLWIPEGKGYRHICPSCGKVQVAMNFGPTLRTT